MSGLELLVPLGLAALAALPVVVLLHMRNSPPQPRPVPTLRFWAAAVQEQTERTRLRRPPLSLLLLLHLLIVGLLALGLTRPATAESWAGLGLRTEPRHVIVLLDGSTSMLATDTDSGRSRFAEARDLALERVADLREGDVATVVLLGTRVTTLEATDAGDFAALRARLASLPPPGGRADLDAALTLTRDLLLPRLADRVVLVSDGALTADPGLVAGLGAPVELVRVGGQSAEDRLAGNVAVTEVSARAAGNTQALYVRVANYSAEPVVVPLVLRADGLEVSRSDVELPAGGTAELSRDLPPDAARVEVEADVRDPLPADDRAALVLRQDSGYDLGLRVLLVSDAPRSLERALAVLPGADLTTVPTDDPAANDAGAAYDLVVYERAAPPARLPEAAVLLVSPPDGGPFPTQGAIAVPAVTSVAADDPLLDGVDLAGVSFGETTVYQPSAGSRSVVAAEAGPLIARGELEGRPYVLLAFDVERSNLPRRVAFPILVGNIAAELVPSPLPPAVPLGDPLVYRPGAGAAAVRVAPPDGPAVDLPLTVGGAEESTAEGAAPDRLRAVSFPDTGQAGEYAVAELDAEGTELGGGRFVVNAGHPTESDLRPNEGLPDLLATAAAAAEASAGANLVDLWPLAVAAALALLTLEWLLALLPRRRRPGIVAAPAGVAR